MHLTDGPERWAAEFGDILRQPGPRSDARWRMWSANLLRSGDLSPSTLVGLWRVICDFDDELAARVATPIRLDFPAVGVGGSGKETFKTFNVTTPATILAAAAGTCVVKGISSSVSAVSGAADVLQTLDIPTCATAEAVAGSVDRYGIAFVSYSTFCPRYARRYDGVFSSLSPLSFFMPIAVLGVSLTSFVLGLAHADVRLAAATIRAVRPELRSGMVVSTAIGPGKVVDEWAPVGVARTAHLGGDQIEVVQRHCGPAPTTWRAAVAHRRSHERNAALVLDSLSPRGCPSRTTLVDVNAATIVTAARDPMPRDNSTALELVREARISGRALRLLQMLRSAGTEEGSDG